MTPLKQFEEAKENLKACEELGPELGPAYRKLHGHLQAELKSATRFLLTHWLDSIGATEAKNLTKVNGTWLYFSQDRRRWINNGTVYGPKSEAEKVEDAKRLQDIGCFKIDYEQVERDTLTKSVEASRLAIDPNNSKRGVCCINAIELCKIIGHEAPTRIALRVLRATLGFTVDHWVTGYEDVWITWTTDKPPVLPDFFRPNVVWKEIPK